MKKTTGISMQTSINNKPTIKYLINSHYYSSIDKVTDISFSKGKFHKVFDLHCIGSFRNNPICLPPVKWWHQE